MSRAGPRASPFLYAPCCCGQVRALAVALGIAGHFGALDYEEHTENITSSELRMESTIDPDKRTAWLRKLDEEGKAMACDCAAASCAANRNCWSSECETEAQQHCPADTVVWVNTPTGIYHFKGMR